MASLLLSIQARLTTTSSLLLERSRVISLNLPPSASSTAQIYRNLSSLLTDIAKLEDENELEASGLNVGGRKGKTSSEASIAEIQDRYDQLLEMFEEDEAGREKAKSLKREIRRPRTLKRAGSVEMSGAGAQDPSPSLDPRLGGNRSEGPFRDDPEDRVPEEAMLAQQQEIMNDQDERLNLLSHSIGRQNHLSIQIGSELDLHHDLLEDTDAAMDRTAARLGRARRRLDTVAHEAKQYGSTITIVVLILILLILIIVFKT